MTSTSASLRAVKRRPKEYFVVGPPLDMVTWAFLKSGMVAWLLCPIQTRIIHTSQIQFLIDMNDLNDSVWSELLHNSALEFADSSTDPTKSGVGVWAFSHGGMDHKTELT